MSGLDRTRIPGASDLESLRVELRDEHDMRKAAQDELVLSEAKRGFSEREQATTQERLAETRADSIAWRNLAYAFAAAFVFAIIALVAVLLR